MGDEKPRTLGEVLNAARLEWSTTYTGVALCSDFEAAAVEREVMARLAKAVAPMTMTAERQTVIRKQLNGAGPLCEPESGCARCDAWREIDALRAALAARDAEIEALTEHRERLSRDVQTFDREWRAMNNARHAALARAETAEAALRDATARAERAERHMARLVEAWATVSCAGPPFCMSHDVLATSHGPNCPKWNGHPEHPARARVAALEAELGRLREAAQAMADNLDLAKIGGKSYRDLRAALAESAGEGTMAEAHINGDLSPGETAQVMDIVHRTIDGERPLIINKIGRRWAARFISGAEILSLAGSPAGWVVNQIIAGPGEDPEIALSQLVDLDVPHTSRTFQTRNPVTTAGDGGKGETGGGATAARPDGSKEGDQ